MKLAASLVVRNEYARYLGVCVTHLLDFCDTVVIVDDNSDDETLRWLQGHPDERVAVYPTPTSTFFKHEGRTRQRLLEHTLAHRPTHVLSIDADELVDNGQRLRTALEAEPDIPFWSLLIEEVRGYNDQHLIVREDGGWRTHDMNCLWRVPEDTRRLRIMDRKLACRRVPTSVWQGRGRPVGASLLHFGWADPAERKARAARYTVHDGGRFHANAHLQSILWSDRDPRMKLREREWPPNDTISLLLRPDAGVASTV